MGVFNQCQTRLLVHLIFLFNFLQEFWWGSNMMESRRKRKILSQQMFFPRNRYNTFVTHHSQNFSFVCGICLFLCFVSHFCNKHGYKTFTSSDGARWNEMFGRIYICFFPQQTYCEYRERQVTHDILNYDIYLVNLVSIK